MRKSDYPEYFGGAKRSRGPRSFSHLMHECREWYDRWYMWPAAKRRKVVVSHLMNFW